MQFLLDKAAIVFQLLMLCGIISAQFSGFQGVQPDCTTPTALAGRCIGIRQCPVLLGLLQTRPLRAGVIDFLRQSQCGFVGADPNVCCPLNADYTSPPSTRPGGDQFVPGTGNERPSIPGSEKPGNPPVTQLNLRGNPFLPTDCGRDLSQRIVGGERTDLDEFPWMVLLEYTRPIGRTTACGGVLISNRYVLTAAHCIRGKDLPRSWSLTGVRLGEYDTESERDCIQDSEDSQVCADDPITVGVEEQIVHEEYKPQSTDQKFDLALLRLSRSVRFTNYIKPICLPTNTTVGQKLFVAGWGKTENKSESNVKLKVSLPLADRNECVRTYSNAGVRLGDSQICAGGLRGKDSCRGDSGGPLMSVERTQDGSGKWTAVGVVSFGPSPCGMLGWPGVYTKVVDFVPWILSKLRQ